VPVNHLKEQLVCLKDGDDINTYSAVYSKLEDEESPCDIGPSQGGKTVLFKPLRLITSSFTEILIRFGMRCK